MALNRTDIAALLCSKLCHDLLSPVGAITNGLELFEDETDPDMRQRCFELLQDSASSSANKLKYFRLAFGSASGYGDTVDPHEARELIEDMVGENSRIELRWLTKPEALPKKAVKIMLNLALVAKEALVRGGSLDIGAEIADAGVEVVIRAVGDKVVLDAGIRSALEGGVSEDEVTVRTVAAWMTRDLVQESGGMLNISPASDTELLLGALIANG